MFLSRRIAPPRATKSLLVLIIYTQCAAAGAGGLTTRHTVELAGHPLHMKTRIFILCMLLHTTLSSTS